MPSLRSRLLALMTLAALPGLSAGCGSDGDAEPSPAAEPQPAEEFAVRARDLGFTRDVPNSLVRECNAVRPADGGEGACPPRWVPRGTTTADGFDFADVKAENAFEVEAQSPDGVPHHQLGHWMFGSGEASDAEVLKQAFATASSKRTTSISGVPATIWLIPPVSRGGEGMHTGHAVVTWSQGERFFWTSFHDHRNAPRARLLAEALIIASDK